LLLSGFYSTDVSVVTCSRRRQSFYTESKRLSEDPSSSLAVVICSAYGHFVSSF